MKKNIIRIICAILSIITVSAFFACSNDSSKKLEEIPSGEELKIGEDTLKVEESFKLKAEKDGYVPGADIKIDISGYPKQLSYFEGQVTFVWEYEYLNDKGKYIPATKTVIVDLDAAGKGTHKETIEFSGARSIKDIELTIEYDGFAVRK